jgi:hypothetical protein
MQTQDKSFDVPLEETSCMIHLKVSILIVCLMFQFEGRQIALDHKVGIFVTMNPEYVGRSQLPESLKALFRPVVCTAPDLGIICHTVLFSEGFLQAKVSRPSTVFRSTVTVYRSIQ